MGRLVAIGFATTCTPILMMAISTLHLGASGKRCNGMNSSNTLWIETTPHDTDDDARRRAVRLAQRYTEETGVQHHAQSYAGGLWFVAPIKGDTQ
jgi:hypothetical protein